MRHGDVPSLNEILYEAVWDKSSVNRKEILLGLEEVFNTSSDVNRGYNSNYFFIIGDNLFLHSSRWKIDISSYISTLCYKIVKFAR